MTNAMTTHAQLLDRAGQALFGPQYVAALAAHLMVDKNTVGKWREGKTRIPPSVWLEIGIMIDIRHNDLSAVKPAVFEVAEANVRLYETEIGSIPVGVSADGTFPTVEYTKGTNGDWRTGFWGALLDHERQLPRGTLAYRLTRGGTPGDPIPLMRRAR